MRRSDFPIREVIGEIQDAAISEMFAPVGPGSDRRPRALKQRRPGETMSLADLFAWTNAAIFDDLGAARIEPLHADLQRRFADLELEIAFLPSAGMDQLGLPREIQALARYNLKPIAAAAGCRLPPATDVATKAHIDDLRSRIDGALAPKTNRSL